MLGAYLAAVRSRAPLVHSITNYVTANDQANILLACGASPVMADDPAEAAQIAAACNGLQLNLGTLSENRLQAMLAAGAQANRRGSPVVLDPVGVGTSSFRRGAVQAIFAGVKVAALRCNRAELGALLGQGGAQRGVDAPAAGGPDGPGGEPAPLAAEIETAKAAAARLGLVVAVTGPVDIVTDGQRCCLVRNGAPQMARVTGTGCQLSALTAAFLAASPQQPLEAAAAAVAAMGLAGQQALARLAPGEGNAGYRGRIIDAVYWMQQGDLDRGEQLEFL